MALKPILGNAFAPVTEDDWRALVAKARGAQSLDALTARSDDRLPVGPIYPAAAEGRVIPGRAPGKRWTIVQRVDHPELADATRQIQDDVEGGAGGIELVFASSPIARGDGLAAASERSLARLLDPMAGLAVDLRIDAGEATAEIAATLLRVVKAGRTETPRGGVTFAFDPIATFAAHGRLERPFGEIARAIASETEELEQLSLEGAGVISDGRIWHAAGASEVQELAATLAGFVAYLRLLDERDLPAERAAPRIGLTLAADADEFLTIAKFRAMRLLHARVLEVSEIDAAPARIHAETSWRMLTRREARVNIARSTIAAFAAIVGGADSITVLPFTSSDGVSDSLARRVARNTQTLLMEESNLYRVRDPGTGSGAVEALTEALAAAAWDEFRAIEAEGGLLAAVRSGSLQEKIAAMRETRLQRIATREIEITGINTRPNLHATSAEPPPRRDASKSPSPASPAAEAATPLVFERLAERFERLRDRADKLATSGRRPAASLVILGTATEDASLAREMLACGGIEPVASEAQTPGTAGLAFASAETPVACVAAAPTHSAEVEAVAASLRDNGARLVLLAGWPTGKEPPDGIDHSVGKGADLVSILSNVLDAIEDSQA